jgi:hypothetical protein
MNSLLEFVVKFVSFKIWREASAHFNADKAANVAKFNAAFEGAIEKVLVLSVLLFGTNLSYWDANRKVLSQSLPSSDVELAASIAWVIVTGFPVYLLANFFVRVITQNDSTTKYAINFAIFFLALTLSVAFVLNLLGAGNLFASTVYPLVSKPLSCLGLNSSTLRNLCTIWLWYVTCSMPIIILAWFNSSRTRSRRSAKGQQNKTNKVGTNSPGNQVALKNSKSILRMLVTVVSMTVLATAYSSKPFKFEVSSKDSLAKPKTEKATQEQ